MKHVRRATHCARCAKPLVSIRVWSFDLHRSPMFSPEYCSQECYDGAPGFAPEGK